MSGDDVRASTASAYDEIVDDFVRRNCEVDAGFAAFRTRFVDDVRAGSNRSATVADLGCGPGRDARAFLEHGLTVVGFDASRGMARHARGEGVAVAQADIRRVPLRAGSLDGIWSAASLLHVPRADVPATLRAWWELLRPGGVLGLSTSLGGDEGWEACPYDPRSQSTAAPLRRWFVHHDEGELLALLADGGFDVSYAEEHVSHRRWLKVLARQS